jgi:hypothetical protein
MINKGFKTSVLPCRPRRTCVYVGVFARSFLLWGQCF